MGKVWLNVGSGMEFEAGFVNLDNSPFLRLAPVAPVVGKVLPGRYRSKLQGFRDARNTGLVRRHDCTDPLPYEPGTVDHILCSHMLEHVPADTMRQMLADFHRVLRPGGTLHVIVPDLRWAIDRYVTGDMSADDLQDWMLFHPQAPKSTRRRVVDASGNFGLSHQWLYDADTMTARLADAGFVVKGDLDTPSSHVRADDVDSLHIFAAA